ncbi:MAG: UDP-N-acetylmuramate dehydrogenase [Saprospiraceae bacterium]
MKIRRNFSLKKLNTFGIGASASLFVAVASVDELREILTTNIAPLYILGGGSNVLFTGDLDGIAVQNNIGGIEIAEERPESCIVAAGAGVNWHGLVLWALDHELGGIENLSLIPGTVGAAPIQNIGAYGVELKDVFEKLEAVNLATGKIREFSAAGCRFGYRDSIFKNEFRGQFFISRVFLRLSKTPVLNTEYGAIQEVLQKRGIPSPGIREVSEAVVHIRQSKLPDPAKLGNAGSFFKNPEISVSQFEALKQQHGSIPSYRLSSGAVKVPAGWLIEKTGWKGRRIGAAGCHDKQALVLVNYGGATGPEILALARRIQASVESSFGIRLVPEVNIW